MKWALQYWHFSCVFSCILEELPLSLHQILIAISLEVGTLQINTLAQTSPPRSFQPWEPLLCFWSDVIQFVYLQGTLQVWLIYLDDSYRSAVPCVPIGQFWFSQAAQNYVKAHTLKHTMAAHTASVSHLTTSLVFLFIAVNLCYYSAMFYLLKLNWRL